MRPEHASTIPTMSEATQVGAPYLRKVLNKLRAAGVVATQRGAGGGVRLSRSPNALTILDIIDAVDPIVRVGQCPLGLPAHVQLCPFHAELDDAISQIEQMLSRKTIGDLLGSRRRGSGRCDFPHEDQLFEL